MENFILYLGKASVLLSIFYLPYYFLLRKETFFNSNRWFLLVGIFASLVVPFFVFTKVVFVEPIIDNFQIPMSSGEFITSDNEDFKINWFDFLGIIYLIGVIFFFGKFIRDILSLIKIINHKNVERREGYKFIDINTIKSPFSFFNYIIYNSEIFSIEELENIIAHEKVHSSQYHSIDMIFGQLLCFIFWFNPFAWLHQRAISQNLEFIADANALEKVSDKIVYQKTLLKVSAPHLCIPITNHFYQSLIKKRIVMLNKNQSNRKNSWKYATVLPLLTIFMLQFQVETVAQVKQGNAYAVAKKSNDTKEVSTYALSSISNETTTIPDSAVANKNLLENQANNEGLYVLNGKKLPKKEKLVISNGEVANVVILNAIDAEKKYGKDGKNGATEITTKKQSGIIQERKLNDENEKPSSDYSLSFKVSSSEETFKNTMNSPNIDPLKALVFIDGKEVTVAEFEALNPDEIRAVSVTGKNSPTIGKFIEKYGERAKSGLIQIQTQKTMKIITLDNHDEVLLFDGNKLKIPGHATIELDNPETTFFINGKKSAGEAVQNLEKMKAVEIIYKDLENKSSFKTVKITI